MDKFLSLLQKLFDPLSLDSNSTKYKGCYLAASIAIGIFTAGIGHAIYALASKASK